MISTCKIRSHSRAQRVLVNLQARYVRHLLGIWTARGKETLARIRKRTVANSSSGECTRSMFINDRQWNLVKQQRSKVSPVFACLLYNVLLVSRRHTDALRGKYKPLTVKSSPLLPSARFAQSLSDFPHSLLQLHNCKPCFSFGDLKAAEVFKKLAIWGTESSREPPFCELTN